MGLCSMSPGDATCSLSSSVTPRPAAQQQGSRHTQQSGALMYPELMFNESSIFRQVHARSENGFIVLLLRAVCVRLHFVKACACVCQTSVYKSLRCRRQVYVLMYSCSECTSTDLQTDIVS